MKSVENGLFPQNFPRILPWEKPVCVVVIFSFLFLMIRRVPQIATVAAMAGGGDDGGRWRMTQEKKIRSHIFLLKKCEIKKLEVWNVLFNYLVKI